MIKTKAYNDFTNMTEFAHSRPSEEELFDMLVEFHEQGGDINLPIMTYSSEKLIEAEEYYRKHFSDESYILKLIEKGMLDNPFKFILDKDNLTILDKESVGMRKLKDSGFYEKYQNQIVSSIHDLAKELSTWEQQPLIYKEWTYENKYKDHTKIHPLAVIATELNKAEIYEAIFSAHSEYTHIFKNKRMKRSRDMFFSREVEEDMYDDIFGSAYTSRLDRAENAWVFYKYGAAHDYFAQEERQTQLKSLVEHAIYQDDIQFLKTFSNNFNLPRLENVGNYYDCFLRKAHSEDMTNYLLDQGVFVQGDWISENADDNEKSENKNVSVFYKEIHPVVLKTILNRPQYQDYLKKNHESFYNTYFEDNSAIKQARIIVESGYFPNEKHDILGFSRTLEKKEHKNGNFDFNGSEWALKHGADPRHCARFIASFVHQSDGVSELKKLHKEKIFNAYYPDSLFHILNSNGKKYFTFIEKAPEGSFSRYTVTGKPAWWGALSEDSWNFIKKINVDFNQSSQEGVSFWNYSISRDNSGRQLKTKINDLIKIKEKSLQPTNFLELGDADKNGNNFFHHLFNRKEYSNTLLDSEIFDLVASHTKNNVMELLAQTNHEGLTPIDMIISTYTHKDKRVTNEHIALNSIFNLIQENPQSVNFDKKLSENKTFLSVLKEVGEISNNKNLKNMDMIYLNWKLARDLPEKEVTKNKIKI